MTRDEAIDRISDYLLDVKGSEEGDLNERLVSSVTEIFKIAVDAIYRSGCVVADRTIGEEEARHLDEEIGRSMQFDNPLSGGGK